jgi:large subunit ribosomal protein L25
MNVEITAQLRNLTGKGPARRLRNEESVPAVLYGPKTAPLSLSVSANRLEKLLRDMAGESKLLQLTVEGEAETVTRQVLIRELQTHPVRRRFVHIDFFEVPMDQAIVVEVPVELVGESVGVKKGGAINVIRRMMSVRCLPGEIPEKGQIDVESLDLGGSIRVGDLVGKVPVELVDDKSAAVVNIAAPEGKKEETEGEAAAAPKKGKK